MTMMAATEPPMSHFGRAPMNSAANMNETPNVDRMIIMSAPSDPRRTPRTVSTSPRITMLERG